jgi:hypothetical protein
MTIADIHAHPSLKTYLFKMKFDRKFFNWNIPYTEKGGFLSPIRVVSFCRNIHTIAKIFRWYLKY